MEFVVVGFVCEYWVKARSNPKCGWGVILSFEILGSFWLVFFLLIGFCFGLLSSEMKWVVDLLRGNCSIDWN